MGTDNILRFYIGDKSELNISKLYERDELNNNLFSESFKQALREIDIVLPKICTNDDLSESNEEECVPLVEKNLNNVFGFIGDRGSGKTSSMMSVAVSLKDSRLFQQKNMGGLYPSIERKQFEVMETIDPSFFDTHVNILDIVIGKLYTTFQSGEKDNQENFILRNDLFECFQEVRRCVANNAGMADLTDDDDVESLEYLSSSVKLQATMQTLINKYLRYCKKQVLVIPIDDMDMHTECGYTMLEYIRKYLIQRNVIILMALKLDQMERVIQLEIAKQYNPLKEWKLIPHTNLIERASRYMSKMLPHSHRIFMPTYDNIADAQLKLYNIRDTTEINSSDNIIQHNNKSWFHLPEDSFPTGTVKYVVTKAIYSKTRYLFYHSKGRVSPIVPNNLRELRYLIALLFNMPDYEKGGTTGYNKKLFIKYFRSSWMTLNLNQAGKELVDDLFGITDTSLINKTVIQKLRNLFPALLNNMDGKDDREQEEIRNIVDIHNSSYNVSIGDVFAILIHLNNRLVDKFDLNLLFAIKTFYSISLVESYDEITDSPFIQRDQIESGLSNDISSNNRLNLISRYHQLIGGSFVNAKYFRLVTPDTQSSIAEDEDRWRGIRKISILKAIRIITVSQERLQQGRFSETSDLHRFQSVELLALFISRKKYDTKNHKQYDSLFRRNIDVVYFDNIIIENGTVSIRQYSKNQTVYYDVSALFFNITDIKLAYDKLDARLYALSNMVKKSILNLIREETIKKYKIAGEELNNPKFSDKDNLFEFNGKKYIQLDIPNYESGRYYDIDTIHRKFLSWCSIRNAEILESFTLRLADHGTGSDVHLYDFMKNASEFYTMTYSTNNKDNAFKIQFDYIKELRPVFTNQYIDNFEDFIILRNNEVKKDTAETISELCDVLLRNGKAKQAIEKAILNTKSPWLASVDRNVLIKSLEKYRRENLGGHAWSKKAFHEIFPVIYEELAEESKRKAAQKEIVK